jgi:transcriptional regulator with XRE-family HTH domain
VASLAAVSTEWYTWLEQGRDVRASEETLRRIAGALRLEPGETRHLLTLAGYGRVDDRRSSAPVHVVGEHLRRLLDQLDPCPAWVLGARWDFLAWNRSATWIHGDLDAMGDLERNAAYQMFLGERMRRILVEWERHAEAIVTLLRGAHANYVDDAWFHEIVEVLLTDSPEFAALWAAHVLHPYQDGMKEYHHPEAGRLAFEYTLLHVTDERFASLSLVTYLPVAGSGTHEKLKALAAEDSAVTTPMMSGRNAHFSMLHDGR